MGTLVNELKKLNYNKNIKIRGNYSYHEKVVVRATLFLEYIKDRNRQRLFLGSKIIKPNRLTKDDKEQINEAILLRERYEIKLAEQPETFVLTNKNDIEDMQSGDLVYYMQKLSDRKQIPAYMGCAKHIKEFVDEKYPDMPIMFKYVDRKFCFEFKDYLLEKLAQNTARSYIKILNAGLNRAIEEGYIKENPCKGINIKYQESKREFLTEKEIKAFAGAETEWVDIQNAFLFSCMTGLRLSDIQKLTFSEIKEGFLYFRQMKTKGVERMKLMPDAVKIIKRQKKLHPNSELVFILNDSKDKINKHIRQIATTAKIKKWLHYHISRHTFATWLITRGVDIYTVSKLLGHRDIATTQVYAKLVDAKKDSYVEKMPKLL
jgi:integrase